MIPLVAALVCALGIDYLLGDPPNRYHPVAWLGRVIGFFVPRMKTKSSASEKVKGAVLAMALVGAAGLAAYLLTFLSISMGGAIAGAVASAVILKVSTAVRGMETHAKAITACLEAGDLAGARHNLSLIVRRRTDELGEKHIASATIECISESTVDGITGPILYYSLLGPAGAFAYRAINTLDSMVAYRDEYYKNIGWMSARLDTGANYVPARITALLMVLSAKILGADWRNSLQVLHRDHDKTFSTNAAYPMATMAGALRIRLEKVGHYALGEEQEPVTLAKCRVAISMMKLTTLLFCLVISIPLMTALYFAGWWRLLLGIP